MKFTLKSTLLPLFILCASCEPSPTYEGELRSNSNSIDDNTEQENNNSDIKTGTGQETNRPHKTVSISALKSLYKGTTIRITTPISICGVVVGNDLRGEFIGRIVVDDGEDGVVILINQEKLFLSYKIGDKVTIKCEDLYLGSDYGVMVLGTKPNEMQVVGSISVRQQSKITLIGESALPRAQIIDPLDLNNRLISRLIRIEKARFKDSDALFCDQDVNSGHTISTSHVVLDEYGNEYRLFVPYSVNYSDQPLPKGWFRINAILEPKYSNCYTLRQTDYGIESK